MHVSDSERERYNAAIPLVRVLGPKEFARLIGVGRKAHVHGLPVANMSHSELLATIGIVSEQADKLRKRVSTSATEGYF